MESNHPFRPEIDILNAKVVEIVTTINDKMNEVDTMNTLQEVCCSLEPPQKDLVIKGRRFVAELNCKGEWNRKGKKEMRVLLLSDILVIAQLYHTIFSSKSMYHYLTQLPLSSLQIRDLDEASFELSSTNCSLSVYCNGVEEKEAFYEQLASIVGRTSFLPNRFYVCFSSFSKHGIQQIWLFPPTSVNRMTPSIAILRNSNLHYSPLLQQKGFTVRTALDDSMLPVCYCLNSHYRML